MTLAEAQQLDVAGPMWELIWRVVVEARWLLLAMLLLGIAKLAFDVFRIRRLRRSGMRDIDDMSGKVFEEYLTTLFFRLGYTVRHTGKCGDYGCDLLIRKDGATTVVQAKRFKRNVGVEAVQEALGAVGMYSSNDAMVVTNSRFTPQAKVLAAKNGIELWDRDILLRHLLQTDAAHGGVEATTSIDSSVTPDACCVCGKRVSPKVYEFCRQNAARFGGRIYCFDHQKTARAS